jgi:hypothetical protein
LPNQSNDLRRQRAVVALFGRRFCYFAAHTMFIRHAHGHFGAANINAGDRRCAGG